MICYVDLERPALGPSLPSEGHTDVFRLAALAATRPDEAVPARA